MDNKKSPSKRDDDLIRENEALQARLDAQAAELQYVFYDTFIQQNIFIYFLCFYVLGALMKLGLLSERPLLRRRPS